MHPRCIPATTNVCGCTHIAFTFQLATHDLSIAYLLVATVHFYTANGGTHMQQLMTFISVVAGLVFSVAVALAIEELIFGKVFQLFFTPVPVRVRADQKR